MHAVIRSISSDEFDMKTYVPENPVCFFLNVRIRIGSNERSGGDDFEFGVCTPGWLNEDLGEPRWGRHLLIVRDYDFAVIEKFICSYVEQCHGDEWSAVAEKLGRVFAWEFEDYQE